MFSIMFILPVGGGSGGAHSVMQEADAMWRLGVPVTIAANTSNAEKLRGAYRDMQTINNHVLGYDDPGHLGALIQERMPKAVVATTNQSVYTMVEAVKAIGRPPGLRLGYYIQDYEPLFYPKGSDDWLTAHGSYGLDPDIVHFAKTRWLQEVVEANHQIQVHKVEPSIDHSVYYPRVSDRLVPRDRLTIAAMLRPATPRRAPRRTVRIMNQVSRLYGDRVTCVTFGCHDEELKHHSLGLDGMRHLGVLRRDEVGDFFRDVDLFLDLSDFQAFGRTAIEAMSCGAVAVVPAHGGAYEYAIHGQNSFIVDVRNDHLILEQVNSFVHFNLSERQEILLNAIQAALRYSPERAALSEIKLLL